MPLRTGFCKSFHLALALYLGAYCASVQGADLSDDPVIESIEGDKVVVIQTPQGHRVGRAGSAVRAGDRIKTGPRASAKLKYPDGSKVLIGRSTEYEVQDEGPDGVRRNQLNAGEVRGLIRPSMKKQAGKSPPRFIIRSKSAVMGVRGTDFVFNLDKKDKAAEVFTLEGKVEVAQTEEALLKGEGVPVTRDQYVRAVEGVPVEAAKSFDREQFEQNLLANQPAFISSIESDQDVKEAQEARQNALPSGQDPVPQNQGQQDSAKSWIGFELFAFRLNGLFVRQKSGGQFLTGQASWNPAVHLLKILTVRLHVSYFPLKSRTQDKTFVGEEIGVLASPQFLEPLILEAGVAGQGWKQLGRQGPVGMVNLGWKRAEGSKVDRIFIGAAIFDQPSSMSDSERNPSLQLRAGIGLRF